MSAESLQTLQGFITIVQNLASDKSYQTIANVVDEIPQLRAQIESKNLETEKLREEINSLKTLHANRIHENLDTYCTQRRKLEGDKEQLSKEISTLRSEIKQKDIAAAELRKSEDNSNEQLDLANKLLEKEKRNLENANSQTKKLRQDLKGKDKEIEELKECLRKEKAQMSEVKTQLQKLSKEKTSLQQDVQSSTASLSEINEFRTKLREEDEALW